MIALEIIDMDRSPVDKILIQPQTHLEAATLPQPVTSER